MKRAWTLALLVAAGCSSISETDPDVDKPKAEAPAPPPPNPKEVELRSVRAQLASKKADLSQANADLDRLAAEKEQVNAADASESKTTRLTQIAGLESEAKRKKQALALDIADLEARLKDLTGTSTSDDPLASALAEDAAIEKDRIETRKAKEEADKKELGKRVADAEAARRAEEEAKAKEKVPGGAAPAAGDESTFEERWAAVILRVRESMQQYKRW
jgi:chromosome segregation ATPase